MSAQTKQHLLPDHVEARVKYLAHASGLKAYVPSVGGGDVTEHKGEYVIKTVTIRNARGRAEGLSLDCEGFVLIPERSAVSDFYDDDQIAAVYDAELEALLRRVTGAARVEIFDHTRRATSLETQKQRMIREPATLIHGDYTARSGPRRLRDHFADAPDEAEALLRHRVAIVNVWRSIAGTVRSAPLAMCDASSVAPGDLVPVERQAKERIGEIHLALPNRAHRWYYFPEMTADEALLFKTYDSATDGRARFTVHTSFDDRSAPSDVSPRESIETRCFVFF